MKKINAKHNNKDRIICVSLPGRHDFYYQPVGSRERIWLFRADVFSISVFAYFRDYGRSQCDGGFSLTLKEFYEFRDYHNLKLSRIMERIPGYIEYVIKNETEETTSFCTWAAWDSRRRRTEAEYVA